MKYKNKKTGEIYELLDHALNATNGHAGQAMTIYAKEGNYDTVYVRESKEFNEKFELLKTEPVNSPEPQQKAASAR